MRKCSRCKVERPTSEFPVDPQRRDGLYPWCKVCKAAYMRNYTLTKPQYHRRREVLRRYGLSWTTYQYMAANQNGCCAVCGDQPTKLPLCVDHDHSTGKIRGLLCHLCNTGLGAFRDRPELLTAAINYLMERVER
jgi:hypothetical protein